MFKKTSSVEFMKYGEVFAENEAEKIVNHNNISLPVQNKNLIYLYQANRDVYLRCIDGVASIVVSHTLNEDDFQEFVAHRVVKINKGVYFNFISISDKSIIELVNHPSLQLRNYFFTKEYSKKRIIPHLRIEELIACYYNVRNANYRFIGEEIQYWEFTFVDNGVLHTMVEDKEYILQSNDCMFYAPHQFHKQWTEDESCSYLTVIFDLNSTDEYIQRMINHVFSLDRSSKVNLEKFVSASNKNTTLDQELMISFLQRILIYILKGTQESHVNIASTPMQQKFENEMLEQVILYINENIFSPFNVEDLCDTFAISRSSIQSLFKNNLGVAPKEYISELKLKKSKELIRESKYSISEIASMLGFSSIHYFSRRFKQQFGINPSDYANTII